MTTEKDPRQELIDVMEHYRNEITAIREKFDREMIEINADHKRRMRTLNRVSAGVAIVMVISIIAIVWGS